MSPRSSKAYQVLAILGNLTFKPLPRGSQEITNGSQWMESERLPSVDPGDFKLTKNIKTINGSQLIFIKNRNKENSHFCIRIPYLASFSQRNEKLRGRTSSKIVWIERK